MAGATIGGAWVHDEPTESTMAWAKSGRYAGRLLAGGWDEACPSYHELSHSDTAVKCVLHETYTQKGWIEGRMRARVT